jgi:hypothetical protein
METKRIFFFVGLGFELKASLAKQALTKLMLYA